MALPPTPAPTPTPAPAPQTDAYLNRVLTRLKQKGVNFQISPNKLNKYDRYAYHLRLSMVNDIDANDPYIRDKIINNKVRKAIIAESGVTVGFNITDCEIKDAVSSNFRTRNAATTEIDMTITEPYSMSLPDKMYLAGQELGTHNWRIIPIFLELEFRGYDENGKILSGTSDSKIHKVYKLNIVDFNSSLTSSGSVYKIKAAVDNSLGFKDNFYIIPQTYNVEIGKKLTLLIQPQTTFQRGGQQQTTGNPFTRAPLVPVASSTATLPNTVRAFFAQLGESITQFYKDLHTRGAPSNTVTFNGPIQLLIYNFQVAPVLADKRLNFKGGQNSRRLSFTINGDGNAEITVGRGISIGSIIDDVLSSLEDTTFFNAYQSGTSGPPSDGGRIRIPRVECRVNNVGFDTILNDYVREITYFITVKESTRPVPSQEFGTAFQTNANNSINRLKWMAEHTVKKAYMYYYSGNNTEITHLDTNFNQLHVIPLPIGKPTVAIPEIGSSLGISPAQAYQNAQTEAAQKNAQIGQLLAEVQVLIAQRIATLTPEGAAIQNSIDAKNAEIRRLTAEIIALNAVAQQSGSQGIVFFDPTILNTPALSGVNENIPFANAVRAQLAAAQQYNNQRAGTRLFVEALKSQLNVNAVNQNNPALLSYIADPRDIVQLLRPGNTQLSDARLLYSTVTAQLYDNQGQMTTIEMEIRGDPYWLGIDNLERTEEFESWYPRLTTASGQPTSGTTIPNLTTNPLMGASDTRSTDFANYNNYDAMFVLLFRSGITPDEKTGYMNLDANVEFFSAIYQCTEVTHIFKDGKFLQKLNATKDNLTDLKADKSILNNPPPEPPARSRRRDQ